MNAFDRYHTIARARLRTLRPPAVYEPSWRELLRWRFVRHLVRTGRITDDLPATAPQSTPFGRATRPRRDWTRPVVWSIAFFGCALIWGGVISLVLNWKGY